MFVAEAIIILKYYICLPELPSTVRQGYMIHSNHQAISNEPGAELWVSILYVALPQKWYRNISRWKSHETQAVWINLVFSNNWDWEFIVTSALHYPVTFSWPIQNYVRVLTVHFIYLSYPWWKQATSGDSKSGIACNALRSKMGVKTDCGENRRGEVREGTTWSCHLESGIVVISKTLSKLLKSLI